MYRQFYQGMELVHLPLFALVLFIVFFLAVIVRAFSKRQRGLYARLEQLPLLDGMHQGMHDGSAEPGNQQRAEAQR